MRKILLTVLLLTSMSAMAIPDYSCVNDCMREGHGLGICSRMCDDGR